MCVSVQYLECTKRLIERHRHGDLGQECFCTVPEAYGVAHSETQAWRVWTGVNST